MRIRSSVRACSELLRPSRQLGIVVIQVLILLTTSELIKSSLAKSEPGFKSQLSVIHEHEEDEDELIGHGLGVSPITNTFNGGSSFGSFHAHNSGLDTISAVDHHLHQPTQGGCEPIKIGMCMELGYNETTMPNLVGHDAQADADALLQTFTPLIQYGCSPHLKLFLCSSHAPMCTDKTPQPIGPCRSLCESVRRKCEPVLTEFGFKWPPSLECSKFYPENNHQHMCIPGPMDMSHGGGFGFRAPPGSGGGSTQWTENTPFTHTGSSKNGEGGREVVHHAIPANPKVLRNPILTDDAMVVFRRIPEDVQPLDTAQIGTGTSVHRNPIITDNVDVHIGCGPRKVWSRGTCWKKCPTNHGPDGENLFSRSELEFARNYTLPWAILSLFSASLSLSLAFRSSKLSTAERPILYIAFSQVLFSLGTIIGTTMELSCFTDKALGVELLAGKGTVPSSCALTFFLTYFFGLATNLWWGILCLSWMLSVSVNLRVSLQQKERSLSHLLTWGTASILTATALIFKKVDADDLTGVCGIGFQDSEALMVFLLIPLGTALALGIACLFFGLISRFWPNWIPRICCFRLNKSQSTTTEASARQNHAYSPVLVFPPPPQSSHHHRHHHHHHHHHQNPSDHEDSSPSFFNPQSVSRFQRRRNVAEDANAVWIRIGIFAFVNILPLACQVGAIAYEFLFKESWENGSGHHPNLQIFLLRLNMSIIPGLTAGVWVLSIFSWKSFSAACAHRFRFLRPKGPEQKVGSATPGNGTSPSVTTTTSPLLVPVPVNSLATTYITLGGRTSEGHGHGGHGHGHRPFAGIVTPRYHQPPLPPLPARNPEPLQLDAWRRTETIV